MSQDSPPKRELFTATDALATRQFPSFIGTGPRRPYSLQRRVVQLKLLTSSRGRSKPLVGAEGTESVGHEREQLLVVSKTLVTGEDGAGVHLEIITQDPSHTDNVLPLCGINTFRNMNTAC